MHSAIGLISLGLRIVFDGGAIFIGRRYFYVLLGLERIIEFEFELKFFARFNRRIECRFALGFIIKSFTGVLEAFRRNGTGTALLLAALLDMKLKGYGYAIIGGVGPAEYYRKVVGAEDISNSTPGLWKNWVESGNVGKIPGFAEKNRDETGM